MNFVHIADLHFDIPFSVISDRADFGQERRIEQREAFRKVIEYVKSNNIEYLFISGDLYEHEYIRSSTIKYINEQFKEIPNTKIYITPGNHDPLVKESYYNVFKWAENVKIFTNSVEKVENDDANIYGYGFNDFEMKDSKLDEISIEDNGKVNILITHGDIYNKSIYNPINLNELKNKKFDYVALGHIHKRDEIYPGSLISLGFDEIGEHGFIYGSINNKILKKEYINIENKEFIISEFDVSNISSEEELIEKINQINTEDNYYEIKLIGYRSFQININMKLIKANIIKIRDNTKINIDIKENNNTLKGIFIRKLNSQLKENKINKQQYEKIFEIGRNILEK